MDENSTKVFEDLLKKPINELEQIANDKTILQENFSLAYMARKDVEMKIDESIKEMTKTALTTHDNKQENQKELDDEIYKRRLQELQYETQKIDREESLEEKKLEDEDNRRVRGVFKAISRYNKLRPIAKMVSKIAKAFKFEKQREIFSNIKEFRTLRPFSRGIGLNLDDIYERLSNGEYVSGQEFDFLLNSSSFDEQLFIRELQNYSKYLDPSSTIIDSQLKDIDFTINAIAENRSGNIESLKSGIKYGAYIGEQTSPNNLFYKSYKEKLSAYIAQQVSNHFLTSQNPENPTTSDATDYYINLDKFNEAERNFLKETYNDIVQRHPDEMNEISKAKKLARANAERYFQMKESHARKAKGPTQRDYDQNTKQLQGSLDEYKRDLEKRPDRDFGGIIDEYDEILLPDISDITPSL